MAMLLGDVVISPSIVEIAPLIAPSIPTALGSVMMDVSKVGVMRRLAWAGVPAPSRTIAAQGSAKNWYAERAGNPVPVAVEISAH